MVDICFSVRRIVFEFMLTAKRQVCLNKRTRLQSASSQIVSFQNIWRTQVATFSENKWKSCLHYQNCRLDIKSITKQLSVLSVIRPYLSYIFFKFVIVNYGSWLYVNAVLFFIHFLSKIGSCTFSPSSKNILIRMFGFIEFCLILKLFVTLAMDLKKMENNKHILKP